MKVIDNTAALEQFCNALAAHEFITVDLEFLREKSYYAKLCLIQVGSVSECAIIDPLAPEISLSPFFALMQNPGVLKVFHSGRQDIEIIYNLSGKIPTPVFDTQIAGQVTGFGEAISYENMVKHILHIELDKTNRLSDWSSRPLKEKQLEYALADVTHLVHIYEYLRDELKKNGRAAWLEEEMQQLCSPQTYTVNPMDAWQRIKHRSHNARFLTILRELAAWREARSQRRNTPRQSLIKDDMLLQIAAVCPSDKGELCALRNMRPEISSGRLGDEILEVLSHAMALPKSAYVTPPREKDLSGSTNALYEFLKMLLKIKSQQEGVVGRLVAADDDLKLFARRHDTKVPFLKGWRREIFGKDALALCRGELYLAYNPDTGQIDFIHKTAAEK